MAFDKGFKQIEKNEALNKMIYAFFRGYESRYYSEPVSSEAPQPTNKEIARHFLKVMKLEGIINEKEICKRYVNFNLELQNDPFGC